MVCVTEGYSGWEGEAPGTLKKGGMQLIVFQVKEVLPGLYEWI